MSGGLYPARSPVRLRGRRPGASSVALALGMACVTGLEPAARAEAPCVTSGPWVQVDFGESPPGIDVRAVLDRLASDLASRGIALCAGPSPSPAQPPLAMIALAPAPGAARQDGAVLLDIEVRDRVTRKRVAREVDLAGIPADGRSTVVALAADELLRASWAELALEPRAAAPPRPVLAPPEAGAVARAVGPLGRERRPRPFALGLRGAASVWSGGLLLYGADAALALVPPRARWLRIELLAGAHAAATRQAPNGRVSGRALSARLGIHAELLGDPGLAALSLGARLGAHAVRFAGEPSDEGLGAARSALAVSAELGPALSVPLSAGSRLVLDLVGTGAPRGVTARDEGAVVTGLSGLGGTVALGLSTEI